VFGLRGRQTIGLSWRWPNNLPAVASDTPRMHAKFPLQE
jgi:hypothetical protein